ncbi:MAG: alpha/beta hydrolase [Beijerinckiaceae bacterium]
MQAGSEKGPLVIARQGWLYAGGAYDETLSGKPMTGQMYVEFQIPESAGPVPIVFVHGGQQNGTNWTGTPDGREGWAQFFLRRGYSTYVVDQVARGRSPHNNPADGALAPLNRDFATRRFIASERFVDWPQGAQHTQWPGEAKPGDVVYDQFIASQNPSLADYARQQLLNADALVALLDQIGPAILVTHSQSGAFGWVVADRRPQLVKALIALEPNGPPVRDVENLGSPDWFADTGRWKVSGLGDVQLTWEPPLKQGETLSWTREDKPQCEGCTCCWRQADPPRKLPNLAQVKTLMVTAQASYHAPYDHCTAQFLAQAGVALDHVYLADRGITGTGHMLMIEKNSDAIANVVYEWLDANVA